MMRVAKRVIKKMIGERYNTNFGAFCLITFAFAIAILVMKTNWVTGIVLAFVCVAIPIFFSLFVKLEFAIYFFLTLSIFIGVPLKIPTSIPIGISFDGSILFTFFGHVFRCYERKDYKSTFKFYPVYFVYAWMAYNFLQVGNPWAASRAAWFYTMRPYVFYPLIFVLTYYQFRTKEQILKVLHYFLVITTICAAWGCYQFLFGYLNFEMMWVLANDAKHLVYINGRWRSFGTTGSPAHFGVLMGLMFNFYAILIPVYKKLSQKIFMMIALLIIFLGLVWSGTRSGFAIVPIGFIIIIGLWGNTKIYIVGAILVAIMTFVIVTPSNNYHIQRIQSTFNASEDESYKERKRNQERIKPWLAKHPIGGGLGSTGIWGMKFSPGTMLSGFAPDSGHVRVMVETGYVGLVIYLAFYFAMLLPAFFKVKVWSLQDQDYKLLILTFFAFYGAFMVVEQAQDINGILPFSVGLWFFSAIFCRLIKLALADELRRWVELNDQRKEEFEEREKRKFAKRQKYLKRLFEE
ncbi:O-antigen ligase [Flammeovirga sp. OC4]|uniref:O-antigen ligase family protein n=1 Tax=Flammeovirga sp. OC4 TaxID=1382345 RepID=UPI0005C62C8B|nr:O-antigen ligase family protein [Flammeovirga sp. OC4]